MPKRKGYLPSCTINNHVLEDVEKIWNSKPQGTSKSSVVEELLALGIESYKKKMSK